MKTIVFHPHFLRRLRRYNDTEDDREAVAKKLLAIPAAFTAIHPGHNHISLLLCFDTKEIMWEKNSSVTNKGQKKITSP